MPRIATHSLHECVLRVGLLSCVYLFPLSGFLRCRNLQWSQHRSRRLIWLPAVPVRLFLPGWFSAALPVPSRHGVSPADRPASRDHLCNVVQARTALSATSAASVAAWHARPVPRARRRVSLLQSSTARWATTAPRAPSFPRTLPVRPAPSRTARRTRASPTVNRVPPDSSVTMQPRRFPIRRSFVRLVNDL